MAFSVELSSDDDPGTSPLLVPGYFISDGTEVELVRIRTPANYATTIPPPPIMTAEGPPAASANTNIFAAYDPFASINSSLLWPMVVLITALVLALVVCAQIVSTYTAAYLAAPREIKTFIDAVEFSIQENESYDRDVSRVAPVEDKIRLERLLREIQKGGDDLREDLNKLVVEEGTTTVRTGPRFLWAVHRKQLEERVRRLDLLRMRFLVVYMGLVAHAAGEREKQAEKIVVTKRAERPEVPLGLRTPESMKARTPRTPPASPTTPTASETPLSPDSERSFGSPHSSDSESTDSELSGSESSSSESPRTPVPRRMPLVPKIPVAPKLPDKLDLDGPRYKKDGESRPSIPRSLSESIKRKPPMMRIRTPNRSSQSAEKPGPPRQASWMDVVAELQTSPLLRQRHASIEEAMRTPPPLDLYESNSPVKSSFCMEPMDMDDDYDLDDIDF